MSASGRIYSLSSFLIFLYGAVAILTRPSASSVDTFVFGGCTQQKYIPGSPFDSNLNLLLSRLVGAAASSAYANFTVVGSSPQDTIYGLYQCRGDLNSGDCSQCVAGAVSRLGTVCSNACGGALQLEGCFVKYDYRSFFGEEDKTVVVRKCGAAIGSDSDALTRLDAALANLATGGGTYRVGGAGNLQSTAQCVGDLSVSECQDCISEAIGQLKSACGGSASGDVYLGKCYARFTISLSVDSQDGGNENENQNGNRNKHTKNNDDGTNKTSSSEKINMTLAISLGLSGVASSITVSITVMYKRNKKKTKPDSVVVLVQKREPDPVVDPEPCVPANTNGDFSVVPPCDGSCVSCGLNPRPQGYFFWDWLLYH